MQCFEHADRAAAGVCKHCGRALCRDCVVIVEGCLSCRGECESRVRRELDLVDRSEKALAERSTPEFGGAIKDDLLELGLGECLVRIGTDWTQIQTPRPVQRLPDDSTQRILAGFAGQIPKETGKREEETETTPTSVGNESEFVQ